MQKEERPDFRNRQAAEKDRHQNEDQIWQRGVGEREQPKGHPGRRSASIPASLTADRTRRAFR
jgi:hypothetical protein